MNLIHSRFTFEGFNARDMLRKIELCGRTCYKSEDNITNDSSEKFVRGVIARGHESVLEHEKITCYIVCDRGVSHELVRHRIASYSQESTRYCNYSKDRFGNELTFIKPCFWPEDSELYLGWKLTMESIEHVYFELLRGGAKPEEARAVLPNSLKTEIVVTMNLREWRHFFSLRAKPEAHPQMRELAYPMLEYLQKLLPAVFESI